MKKLLLLLLILPVVSFGQGNPFYSGIAKLEKKDLEGAISDFTKYITENPNFPAA